MSDPRHIPEVELWRQYEAEKRSWADEHPQATSKEYEQAMRAIADRLGL